MTGIFRFMAPVCLLACFMGCTKDTAVTPVTPDTTAPVTDTFPENKVDRAFLLQLVNGLRSRGCNCGNTPMPPVPALGWNGTLEKAAWLHSKDMKEQNYFDHITPGGTGPGQRLDAAGYHWLTYGENIATGHMDEQALILGWLSSPKHCMNMMAPRFRELGIGRYDAYWTMVLGSSK